MGLVRVHLLTRKEVSKLGKYTEKDAGKDTGASNKDVAAAHHQARDDSGARSGNDAKEFDKAPNWADPTTESGTSLFPKDK